MDPETPVQLDAETWLRVSRHALNKSDPLRRPKCVFQHIQTINHGVQAASGCNWLQYQLHFAGFWGQLRLIDS
jgi:hypothetical protein